jgi:hypothetical protein
MSAATIWVPGRLQRGSIIRTHGVLSKVWAFANRPSLPVAPAAPPEPHMAFYRKYTEALLARYVRMSMEAGKVPSLLGQEMLRGNVSSYRVESFEDVVIFLHDVEHSMEKLEPGQQHLITRLNLQGFTMGEVSFALRLDPRTVIRRHTRALDHLTRIFLDVGMLALNPPPLKRCQGGKN